MVDKARCRTVSEYSNTITSNFPVLEEHGKKVLGKSFADKLKSHFEPISANMQALNKKNTNATPTTTDAKEVLHSMLDDDELDAKMEQIFHPLGAMFAMSTNYLIATCLVRHPKEFRKLVSGQNHAAASFRWLGNVQGMKNYILHPYNFSKKLNGTLVYNIFRQIYHLDESKHLIMINQRLEFTKRQRTVFKLTLL